MFTRNAVPALTFLWSLAAIVIGLTVLQGCQTDMVNAPVGPAQVHQQQPNGPGMQGMNTTGCNTTSGSLQPSKSLTLTVGTATVSYQQNSVLVPQTVSFSLCDWDPTGTNLGSKQQSFGPLPSLTFLLPASVKLALLDAGLPPNTANNRVYNVFRQNETTLNWEFQQSGTVKDGKVTYSINRNGTFAISLESAWQVTGVITASAGGTLALLNSSLVAPPGAVKDSVGVTMTLKDTTWASTSTTFPVVGSAAASGTFLPKLYVFGPDGAQFNVKTVLHVAFADAGFDGVNPDGVRFYYQDPVSQTWVAQETDYNLANQEFIVYLQHFSRYCFIRY
jgi:hypothetical protein